jgi:hypothetical protein
LLINLELLLKKSIKNRRFNMHQVSRKKKLFRNLLFTVFFVSLFVSSAVSLSAMTYEVGFKVVNNSGTPQHIRVTMYKRYGGEFVGSVWSRSSFDGSGYNFALDLNGTNSGLDHVIYVDPDEVYGVDYVIFFHYTSGTTALCFRRDWCPPTGYDTFYIIKPSGWSVDPEANSADCEEILCCYPNCVIEYPFDVSLRIARERYVGSKIVFTLRATASGGGTNPVYTFSWNNAVGQDGPNTNPNEAVRTILMTQTVTVSVTVTSSQEPNNPITRSIVLSGDGM